MEVRSRDGAEEFTTLDGSTIRVLLDAALGGAANQSLAEATLGAGRATQRHYHAKSEEIYVLLEGGGEMEVEATSARWGRATRSSSRPAPGIGSKRARTALASSAAALLRTRMTTRFSLSL